MHTSKVFLEKWMDGMSENLGRGIVLNDLRKALIQMKQGKSSRAYVCVNHVLCTRATHMPFQHINGIYNGRTCSENDRTSHIPQTMLTHIFQEISAGEMIR